MQIKRNFDILEKLVNETKPPVALAVKRNNKWETFTPQDYQKYANYFSYGLLELGFKKGDKIITISNNRPEWNFVDMGMGQIGVIHVPVYPNMSIGEYEFIFEHSEARMIIVSSAEYYLKAKTAADKLQNIEKIYTFDKLDGAPNWEEIIQLGRENEHKWKDKLQQIKDSIQPDDLLSIIYTSGTTGRPKGVMLSHWNFMSNVLATTPLYPIEKGHGYMSILPLCHVFEREVNYMIQNKGATIYYAEKIDTLVRDIKEVPVHGFAAVPRVYEKIYDRIIVEGKKLKGLKKKIFFWAIDIGLVYDPNENKGLWYNLQLSLARKLVFKKWQEALGGKIIALISGGAALQPRLARIFHAAQMPIYEGYGLTETSPVIAVNYPGHVKIGTVGPVLSNVKVKIAEDGEILVKGPNVMKGYYKDPEKTAQVFDEEGWFHTGDIGELDEDGFLKITDRKKEMFKLSTGKYVAPQVVENIFKESPFIDQLFVVGEKEKFVAAIISPDFEYLIAWAVKNGIIFRDTQELIKHPKVIERFQQEIDKYNKRLGRHEQIKKFALTCRKWTPETGELSPTLKLKRKYLKQLYKAKLDYLYGYTDDPGDLGLRKEDDLLSISSMPNPPENTVTPEDSTTSDDD